MASLPSSATKIQPDLSDCHEARVGCVGVQLLLEPVQIGIGRLSDKQGVYAQGIAVPKTVRQLSHRCKICDRYSRNQTVADAGGTRTLSHRIDVSGQFGGVKVAVGIHPNHGHIMPQVRCTAAGRHSKSGANVIP